MQKFFKPILVLTFMLFLVETVKAQSGETESKKEFLQITTIESVLTGGLGRSKMIITNPDGSQQESDYNNLFSVTGISFKNIRENDEQLIRLLKKYTNAGWRLEQVTPLTLSQSEAGSGGIFMTRYLFSRMENKKPGSDSQ